MPAARGSLVAGVASIRQGSRPATLERKIEKQPLSPSVVQKSDWIVTAAPIELDAVAPTRPGRRRCWPAILATLAMCAVITAVAAACLLLIGGQPSSDPPHVALSQSGGGVHEAALRSQTEWQDTGLVPSRDAMLNLTFALRPNNWDLASELLLNISTHGHPQRHKCAR